MLTSAFIILSVAVIVKKINKKALYICLVCAITGYLFAVVSAIVAFANTPRWFTSLSPLVYIAFFIGLCFHIFLVARGIVFKARQDEDYAEYNAILFEQAQEEIAANNKAIERLKARQEKLERGSPEYIKLEKMTKKYIEGLKHKNRKTHIKTKITLVFLFAIMVIISFFVYSTLNNYNALLTQNINTTAMNQAEQVSAIY